ncbi:hypothetical protein BDV97DRAFT_369799 [Delphinella strobiligena]|nr:hypothetical protein BDV97DRAFT_369799 [Delphinella strobiligena]
MAFLYVPNMGEAYQGQAGGPPSSQTQTQIPLHIHTATATPTPTALTHYHPPATAHQNLCTCFLPPPPDFTAATAPPSLIPLILHHLNRIFPSQHLFRVTPQIHPRNSYESYSLYHVEAYECYTNGNYGPLLVVGEVASTTHGAYRNLLGLLAVLGDRYLEFGGVVPVGVGMITGAEDFCFGCERPRAGPGGVQQGLIGEG